MTRTRLAARSISTRCRDKTGRQAGFTVIELIAGSVVSLTLAAVLLETTLSVSSSLSTLNARGLVHIELSQATQSFTQDARLASTTASSCPHDGAFAEDLTSADNGRAILIFHVASLDGAGQPLTSSVDCLIYDFNRGAQQTAPLNRIVRAAPGTSRPNGQRTVAQFISAVTFNNFGTPPPPPAGMVTIIVTATRTEGQWTHQRALDASAALRN